MNWNLWLRRILLAIALCVATLGLFALWSAPAQPILAADPPLYGSFKTVTPSVIWPGDTVTFTIVLSNSSASDAAVMVVDPRPEGIHYLAVTGTGTLILNTDSITWTGNVAAFQAVTITLHAQADPRLRGGAVVTNTAIISDGVNLVEKSVMLRIGARVYLPLIARRWPPVPYTPVLNPISNPTYSGSYTVAWQAADLATSYVLQEDDNSSFSSPQEYDVGDALSKAFVDKAGGRHYYRVRGYNVWGPGEWSNVESTLVGFFYDDFSNSSSGWRIASHPLYTLGYQDGEYQIYVPIDMRCNCGSTVDTWFDQPVVLAPVQPPSGSPYCVSVDTRFASRPGWWETHGLVFGASASLRTVYKLEANVNGDWAVTKFTDYTFPYGAIHAGDQAIIDWHGEETYKGRLHLKVVVNGTTALFYINGVALDFAEKLNDLPSLNRVGVLGGPYEVTPVDSRFDNFMWSADVNACP